MADDVFRLMPGGTGWTFLRNEYSRSLLILMGAVGLVLMIACANVASLLLARASARQREIAVRLAIGAGRGRIVRQLLTESFLLSTVGAAAGVGLAWWSGPYLLGLISTAPTFDLTPNRNVLAFTAAIATATGVAFGLAPALLITAAGPGPALRADARMTRRRSRLLPSLVSAQVALSAVLLVAGGLFLRTLQNLTGFDPGFDANGVLLVDFEGRRTGLSPTLLDDVRRVPGVVSASVSTHTPLSGALWSEPAVPLGQPVPERDTAIFVGASPAFFATMGIPLLAGREFTERDDSAGALAAIVNERFAAHYFPGKLPIGARLSAVLRGHARELKIVGVVKDVYARSLRQEAPRTVYVPYLQIPGSVAPGSIWPLGVPTTLEVRVSGPIGQVAAALESALRARMPDATIEVRPLAAQVSATLAQERMMATLATAFGVLAVVLASVGLYGLLAYGVAQRAKEIGLRLALGARRAQVMVSVLGGAARLVGAGLVMGLPVAWAAARFVRSMLFGLTPTDPIATSAAVATLVTAALVASYLPARRASRLDPVAALRND
jgi:predicted permease